MSDESSLTSPEGVLMLCIAVCLDICGAILAIISLVVVTVPLTFWLGVLLDICAIIIIGAWMLIMGDGGETAKNKTKETTKKIKDRIEKTSKETTEKAAEKTAENVAKKEAQVVSKTVGKSVAKRGGLRFLVVIIGEFFVFLNFLPLWTWFVWKELGGMSGGGGSKQEESEDGTGESQEKVSPNLPQRDTAPTEKK